jgi:hypothetical protein
MRYLLTLALIAISGCCPLRDMSVYRTEIDFSDLMVNRQASTVRRFLASSCSCSEGTWDATPGVNVSSEDCASASDWYFTYSARWAWHVEMMRYNGGVSSTDPGEAPEIAPSCDLPEVPSPSAGGDS